MTFKALLQELVPRSSNRREEDADAIPCQELKIRRVFSIHVPTEFGGGGSRHSDMCAFLAGLLD